LFMIVIQTYKDFSDNINLSNHYFKTERR